MEETWNQRPSGKFFFQNFVGSRNKYGEIHSPLAFTKVKVNEEEFGGKSIVYNSSKSWGVSIKLVTDIRRNKKGKITKYLLSEIGWVSPEEALSLICQREIDSARLVFPIAGTIFLLPVSWLIRFKQAGLLFRREMVPYLAGCLKQR